MVTAAFRLALGRTREFTASQNGRNEPAGHPHTHRSKRYFSAVINMDCARDLIAGIFSNTVPIETDGRISNDGMPGSRKSLNSTQMLRYPAHCSFVPTKDLENAISCGSRRASRRSTAKLKIR